MEGLELFSQLEHCSQHHSIPSTLLPFLSPHPPPPPSPPSPGSPCWSAPAGPRCWPGSPGCVPPPGLWSPQMCPGSLEEPNSHTVNSSPTGGTGTGGRPLTPRSEETNSPSMRSSFFFNSLYFWLRSPAVEKDRRKSI